jgi:hypothetical protein
MFNSELLGAIRVHVCSVLLKKTIPQSVKMKIMKTKPEQNKDELCSSVARFFLVQTYQIGEKYTT